MVTPLVTISESGADARSHTSTPTHSLLGIPGHKRIIQSDEGSGYNSATFEGKETQLEAGKFEESPRVLCWPTVLTTVMDEIDRRGFIPEPLIESETKVCLQRVFEFISRLY